MLKHILLTIDVEDWFQVENFKPQIPFGTWPSCEMRVEKNIQRLLDLFDNSASTQNSELRTQNSIKATFFILGWIANRLPHLVGEIQNRGHEVASHGYNHKPCTTCSTEVLRSDLLNSKKRLEDIINGPVYGYRAPSFSINNEILTLIEECGYCYDSSYNSFSLHNRYGKLKVGQNGHPGTAIPMPSTPKFNTQNSKSNIFYELPISNLELRDAISYQLSAISPSRNRTKWASPGFVLPWGGGAYFRLIPFPFFKKGVQTIFKNKDAYLFYMHPWELDPDQPKVKAASISHKIRHYTNLKNTETKLSRFLTAFGHCRFITCKEYLETLVP